MALYCRLFCEGQQKRIGLLGVLKKQVMKKNFANNTVTTIF
jgi:hypothetical protein